MAIWNTQIIAQAVLFVKSGFMGGEREKDMKIQRYEIQRYGTGGSWGLCVSPSLILWEKTFLLRFSRPHKPIMPKSSLESKTFLERKVLVGFGAKPQEQFSKKKRALACLR